MRTTLKLFRIGKHLTQKKIAGEIGVSRATYSFIERGIRSGNFEFWENLQKAFGVPDEEMYKLQKKD